MARPSTFNVLPSGAQSVCIDGRNITLGKRAHSLSVEILRATASTLPHCKMPTRLSVLDSECLNAFSKARRCLPEDRVRQSFSLRSLRLRSYSVAASDASTPALALIYYNMFSAIPHSGRTRTSKVNSGQVKGKVPLPI